MKEIYKMCRCRFSLIAAASLAGVIAIAGCGPSADTNNSAAKPGTGSTAADNAAGTDGSPGTVGAGSKPEKAKLDPSK
jgi:hypothetical protein